MPSPTNDFLNPASIVIPNVTEAVRDTLVCELGTLIFNIDTSKLNFCDVAHTAAAASWAIITSG